MILKIETYSSESKDRNLGIVTQVIELQKNLIIRRDEEPKGHGFLISFFTASELTNLLDHGAILITAHLQDMLCGYILLTSIKEFTSLYSKESTGTIEWASSFNPSDTDNAMYLYQIATSPLFLRMGIGSRLMEQTKKLSNDKNIITDILTSPIHNRNSIRFFSGAGFHPIGCLSLSNYRDFGTLKSEVLIWKNTNL